MRFRLEKVLIHRRTQEGLAQQELAVAQQYEKKLQQELTVAQERLALSEKEFEKHKQTGLTSQELILYQEYFRQQFELLMELEKRWEWARQEVNDKLAELVAASKGKKLLEKLKEKRSEEFHKELLHIENNALDEIAIQQFYRR